MLSKEVEARTKEGQRWMAGFRQGMERTSELEKGRIEIEMVMGRLSKYAMTCLAWSRSVTLLQSH